MTVTDRIEINPKVMLGKPVIWSMRTKRRRAASFCFGSRRGPAEISPERS